MSVRLKVLHGAIKKRGEWQLTVPIKKSPFIIGQASDSNMRCYGRAISEYHCEIRVRGVEVFVRDLGSESGTFVNGEQLTDVKQFVNGDQLRLGRLAFELLIQTPPSELQPDAFGDFVSEMLLDADEAERRDRARTPEARWYQVEPNTPLDPFEGMTPKERLIAKARQKLPLKQAKPMKLPRREYRANSTSQAVTEMLATYYQGLDVDSNSWSISNR
ncbi:MAG: FHA domain-containing protein [Planctomycetaceae bacterium]|nr:FHA domain-containing protein [Planctomycetales bacterium]MCB9921385.1 FHA domain-containing protein [Planctomycetaceae bacterium]